MQLITDNSGAGSSGCAGHYVSEGGGSSNLSKESKVLGISRLSLNDYPENCSSAATAMDVSYSFSGVSSSSISSSGSETGIFTNDDGREGIQWLSRSLYLVEFRALFPRIVCI